MMRLLVVVLALANLAYAAWANSRSQPEPIVEQPAVIFSATDPGIPGLEFAHLTQALETPAVDSAGVAAVPGNEPLQQCFSLGPLTTITELRRARDRLAATALKMRDRETAAEVERGYWVYLRPLASRNEALEVAGQLESIGVTDYFVVTSGEMENAVSLGLYSSQDNADVRAEQVRGLGFENVQADVNHETQPRWWLDYEKQPEMESPWEYLVKASPGSRHFSIPCWEDQAALIQASNEAEEPAVTGGNSESE